MPFPATSETCYVAPPTSAPTFPPPPSLSLAAFSRPFTSLLECFFSFAECFLQHFQHAVASTWTRRPLLPRLLPAPGSSHQSHPSPCRAARARWLLQTLLVAKTSPRSASGGTTIGFAAGGALRGLGDSDAEGRASTGGQSAAGRV